MNTIMQQQQPLVKFNREYEYNRILEEIRAQEAPTKSTLIKNAVFYAVLIVAVLVAFIYSGNNDNGKRFGPFAYSTVLTRSMDSVYPKGSLVMTWQLKPGEELKAGLDIGTDIMFTLDESGTTYVHRIIEIIENYEESGQRGFKTQGVDNPSPDNWVAYEGNIVGRVTWHVPYMGDILAFIGENILWVCVFIAVLFAIATLLKIVFSKEKETATN